MSTPVSQPRQESGVELITNVITDLTAAFHAFTAKTNTRAHALEMLISQSTPRELR